MNFFLGKLKMPHIGCGRSAERLIFYSCNDFKIRTMISLIKNTIYLKIKCKRHCVNSMVCRKMCELAKLISGNMKNPKIFTCASINVLQ